MEIVDNGFILAIPGAIHAELDSVLFWASLVLSLLIVLWWHFRSIAGSLQEGRDTPSYTALQ